MHFKCVLCTLGKPKLVSQKSNKFCNVTKWKYAEIFALLFPGRTHHFRFFINIFFFQFWNLIKFLYTILPLEFIKILHHRNICLYSHLFNIQHSLVRCHQTEPEHEPPKKKKKKKQYEKLQWAGLPVCLRSQNLNCQAAKISNEKEMH